MESHEEPGDSIRVASLWRTMMGGAVKERRGTRMGWGSEGL